MEIIVGDVIMDTDIKGCGDGRGDGAGHSGMLLDRIALLKNGTDDSRPSITSFTDLFNPYFDASSGDGRGKSDGTGK